MTLPCFSLAGVNAQAKWVVVGGDGLIGRHLTNQSFPERLNILPTTRRRELRDGWLFADLDAGKVTDVIAARADVVLLCAAMTNMRACRENPGLSYRVNVTATVELASRLVEQGAFVVFLSSNTVFDGSTEKPNEHQSYSAVTEYGLQKAEAERQLQALSGASERIAVVRLSKVLSPKTGMAAEFMRCFRTKESCRAFDDLRMSPISLRYVTDGLLAIGSRKLAGIFHLSGADELSYAEFASRLAAHLGADTETVRSMSSRDANVEVLFNPRFPALGMTRTREVLGIAPEPIDCVLEALAENL